MTSALRVWWLSVLVLLWVGGAAHVVADGVDPDALTLADFAFLQGADESFVQAYRVFLEARAGDQEEGGPVPTYGQAARAFAQVTQSAADAQMRARCVWFAAFCRFLDMDFAGAADAADELAMQAASARLRQVLGRLEEGEIASLKDLPSVLRPPQVDGLSLEEEVAAKLAGILDRCIQTREARARLTTYNLRTRLCEVGTLREQLRTIAVLACLSGEMCVSISQTREKLDQTLCAANLRYLGVCAHLYAQDHDGMFPEAYDYAARQIWQLKVLPYTGSASWDERSDAWRCPSCNPGGYSYGINQNVSIRSDSDPAQGSRNRVARPALTVLLADSVHFMPGEYPHKPNHGGAAYKIHAPKEHSGTGTIDWDRHEGGANVLFVDGSVQWRPSAAPPEWTGR